MRTAGKTVWLGRWCLPALVVALGLGASAQVRADNIDQKLIEKASEIMKYLKDHKYKNVGVLKFTVQKGDKGKESYAAGEMNSNMATRLENALILLEDPKNPIGIIHDASRTAASRQLSSRDAKGRRGMFEENKFHLAWGKDTVKADAFLTGDVKISSDNKNAHVSIKIFDAKTDKKEILKFDTKTDHNILSEAGQSWRLPRSLRPTKKSRDFDGEKQDEAAANNATQQDQGKDPPVADKADEPVKLHVIFDGNEVPIEADPANPGERRVRMLKKKRDVGTKTTDVSSSGPTQSVQFIIENTGKDSYGVVLKVNGQNTVFLEEEEADKCTKWVIGPGQKYTIKGFFTQLDGKNLSPFKVLSDEESQKLADEWKDNDKLGLIDFHVFQAGGAELKVAEARKPSLRGLSKRTLGMQKPASLEAMQAALHKSTHTSRSVKDNSKLEVNRRGLIDQAKEATQAGDTITKVPFENPVEIYHTSIRYYTVSSATTPKN